MHDAASPAAHPHDGPEPTRPGPRGRRRGRSDDAQERMEEFAGDDNAFVLYFKERIYATFTGLAIVLVVAAAEHPEPQHAVLALLLGVAGITIAGFVSDVIAHLAVHQHLPSAREVAIMVRIAGGAIGTVVVPGILLVLAWLEVMPFSAALTAATVVYIVTLAVVGWFAVRRSTLPWWKQALVLVALAGLGFAVIGIQLLAKLA